MRLRCFQCLLLIFAGLWLAAATWAQSAPPATAKNGVAPKGFTWTESYEGSGNSDGFITDIDSTVGYQFNEHFGVDVGVPYLLVRPSSSVTGTSSANGIGDPYADLKYSTKGPLLGFSTSVKGTAPAASTAKGLSTGHMTFDWDSRFNHEFDFFTPFLDAGVANSLPDTRFLHRSVISFGKLAHFEGGSEFDLGHKFSVSGSGYYILPWGTQQIIARGRKSTASTKGDASLTRDGGLNLGVDYDLSRVVDLGAGYSRSAYSALNTFSFGIGLNVSSLLKPRMTQP